MYRQKELIGKPALLLLLTNRRHRKILVSFKPVDKETRILGGTKSTAVSY